MKISGRRTYLVSLESVAMTDIIMNMFIFFFISFSLLYTFSPYRVKKLEVKLPEANSATAMSNKKQLNIKFTEEEFKTVSILQEEYALNISQFIKNSLKQQLEKSKREK